MLLPMSGSSMGENCAIPKKGALLWAGLHCRLASCRRGRCDRQKVARTQVWQSLLSIGVPSAAAFAPDRLERRYITGP